jgi:serine/threonine protein kinase
MTKPLTSPGRLVAGRYRLVSQIGGGGMGTVWLAKDELLGRQVAIKQVLSPATVSPKEADQQRQRALREGRIAARLSHPHAISVYDVALEHGQPWLVMEYLPSRSLAAVLVEDGVLPVGLVAQIGAQVADALAATHAAGIVHRDVKPANILIGQGGRVEGLVKITDFGISHASGDITLTQTGQITGTPAFLSPEVAQGREMTEASDVFSLGATLYSCLEGQPPFGMEENALAMLHRVAGAEIRSPRRAGVLTDPLLRMLAADPADRPTMAEVRDELARIAAGRGGDTTTVLLARTDLGSSGRARTESFPGEPTAPPDGAAAAGLAASAATPPEAPPKPPTRSFDRPTRSDVPTPPAEPEPIRTPPPAPPVADANSPQPEPERRRRGGVWVAVGILAVLLAGLLVFFVTRPDDPGAQNDAANTSAPTTSPEPSATTTEQTQESSQASSPASSSASRPASTTTAQPTTTSPAADPLSARNIANFLQSYHAQVLTDPRNTYETLTGPRLKSAISEGGYVRYWGQFSAVRISGIQATDGEATATGTLSWTYKSDGHTDSARRLFTLLVRNGHLVLDSETNP